MNQRAMPRWLLILTAAAAAASALSAGNAGLHQGRAARQCQQVAPISRTRACHLRPRTGTIVRRLSHSRGSECQDGVGEYPARFWFVARAATEVLFAYDS